MEAWTSVFGLVGTGLATAINFMPIPSFITLWKTRDLKLISHSFFLLNGLNSTLWLSMGVVTNTLDVIRTNVMVLLCSTAYLTVYHSVKGDLHRFMSLYIVGLAGLLCVLVSYCSGDFITTVAGVVNTLLALAPLEQLRHVCREKENKYIDMYIISLALPCNFCWLLFGLSLEIWAMVVPSLLGTLSCSALIILFCVYQKKGHKVVWRKKRSVLGISV